MDEPIIELHDLTKQYGKFTAVDHINLTVHKGYWDRTEPENPRQY